MNRLIAHCLRYERAFLRLARRMPGLAPFLAMIWFFGNGIALACVANAVFILGRNWLPLSLQAVWEAVVFASVGGLMIALTFTSFRMLRIATDFNGFDARAAARDEHLTEKIVEAEAWFWHPFKRFRSDAKPATSRPMKPLGLPPIDPPRAPVAPSPDGAVDAHFHMLSDAETFPLWENRVEDPAPGRDFDGWIETFQRHCATLGITRGVVVHSIFYGTDNRVTLEATKRLGPGFKSICLVSDGAEEAELDALAAAGCIGVRLNYVHGGVLSWEGAKALAPKLAARGMHIQMLMNAHKHMAEIAEDVAALPCPVVFDHCGWPDMTAGPDEPGFQALCSAIQGNAWVKLSGIYRLCDAPYAESDGHVAALVAANPDQCLWGSDWPHIMLADATTPDSGLLLDALARAVPDAATRQKILVDNPVRLYALP